jgi:hypothetical protein
MGFIVKKNIKKIILEHLEKIKLDEVLEPLKTSYLKKVNQRKFGFLVDSYLFETNKNNKYEVLGKVIYLIQGNRLLRVKSN